MNETAISYLNAGLYVLPAIAVEKRPAVGSWKQYQQRFPAIGHRLSEVSKSLANTFQKGMEIEKSFAP